MSIEQLIGNALQMAGNLASKVQEQLQKQNEYQQQLASLHASLDMLRARYNLEKSYLSQLADWYGAKSWYDRGQYFLLIAACSALIGMALAATLEAIIIISASLFLLITYLIDEHYSNTTHRDSVFADDILKLEEQLNASILAICNAPQRLI